MADLDTRAKRESGFSVGLYFARVHMPNPDGSDAATESERAHLAFTYNGISTTAITFQSAWASGSNVVIVAGTHMR